MKRYLLLVWLVLLSAVLLSACANLRPLGQLDGVVLVLEADRPDYDLKIYVSNTVVLGGEYNFDKAEDRRKRIPECFECENFEVIEEKFIPLGRVWGFSGSGQWLMKVRCTQKTKTASTVK